MAEAIALEATAPEAAEKKNVVVFKKPYKFEGKEYTELDLSGMERLTVQDVIDIQRELIEQGNTAALGAIEATTGYAMALATKACRKPGELFKLMHRNTMEQGQEAILRALAGSQHRERGEAQITAHGVQCDRT